MSEWRDIWAESIKANKTLIRSRGKGEVDFRKLLGLYPNDGMIYYSRGEGYEYLHEYNLAILDYQKAAESFPAPHWQKVALNAIERVRKSQTSGIECGSGKNWWEYLHRVYGVPNIPHKIRVDALSAIERFDSEPHMSAGLLRMSLEEIVNYILNNARVYYSENEELEKKIDKIEARCLISPGIASKMQLVRDKGNKGVHREKGFRDINFSIVLENFVEVIEELGKKNITRIPRRQIRQIAEFR